MQFFSYFLLFLVFGVGHKQAFANSTSIKELDILLAQAKTVEQQANIYLYKARYFANDGEYQKALINSNIALQRNHRGWIHLERSRFFIAHKKYKQAEAEASAAVSETATLHQQADPIIREARREIDKAYLEKNPPTIIFNEKANTRRKSRFDYARRGDPTKAVEAYSKALSNNRKRAAKSSGKKKTVRRS